MDIKFKRLTSDAILPTKAHPTDVGLDLYAAEEVILRAFTPTKVSTQIACGFPQGVAGLILDRSSMASKGVKVYGGVIDQAYTGELIICLVCAVDKIFPKGSKIAQLVLIPSYAVNITEVEQLEETDRGSKGFGSSGA